MEYESYNDIYGHAWYNHKIIYVRTGGIGNKRMSGDNPNYCIVEKNLET